MTPTKRPMTKSEKLRRASKAFWVLSTLMTITLFASITSEMTMDPAVEMVIAIIVGVLFQYGITLYESALFDGSIPAPWNVDWYAGGPLPWIVVGATVCLIVDVMVNFGGVNFFVSKLDRTGIGALGLSDYIMLFVQKLLTFVISVLTAVGSELMDEYAKYLEDNGKGPRQQPVQVKEHRGNDDNERARMLAERAAREARETERQPERGNERTEQRGDTKTRRLS